jgi:hypothetical protein
MNEAERQTHREYIKILKRMTPQQRLQRALELSDLTKRTRKQVPIYLKDSG